MAEVKVSPVTLDIVKDSLIAVSNEGVLRICPDIHEPHHLRDSGLCQRHCGCEREAADPGQRRPAALSA